MIYKIAVCDDEKINRDDIVSKLRSHNSNFIITEFESGEELLGSNQDFNLIFLDIEMNGISGMDTAFDLRKNNFDGIIIFLTSHTEFMPDAFKVKAFRFLSKPIDNKKFEESLIEAEKEIINTKHVIVQEKNQMVYLKLTDIMYLEAYGDKTYIYDKKFNTYITDKSLKYWKAQIGNEHFYQIHKSIIVSFLFVGDISKDGKISIVNSTTKLDISRRNQNSFKQAFIDYIRKYAKVI